MRWVTREHAKVDRIACPWLIKRFVDPDAKFLFVPPEQVMEVARKENATPFDVAEVELGHHGDECSFDAIIAKFHITDPAILELARIVRGADTQFKDLTPESKGLEAIASGFRAITSNDYENMSKQFPVYDALYEFCKQKLAET